MRSLLARSLVALAVVSLIVQVALPPYVASRVEDRLEEGGGTAEVSVGAFPAVSLLAGRGGSVEATGSGLSFDLGERRDNPLKRLDGFERVDVRLRDLVAGAVRMRRFELSRGGRGDDYELRVTGTSTPRRLAEELGRAAAGPLGRLLGSLASGLVPGASVAPVPFELRATAHSRRGRAEVTEAHGSVAGLPAGPLAKVVLSVVLNRL